MKTHVTIMLTALAGLTLAGSAGADTTQDFCQVAGPSCLSFDGVDDYVDLGNGPSLQFNDNVTVSAWVQLGAGTAGRWMGIAGKMSGDSYSGFGIGYYSNNGFIFFTGSGGSVLDGVYSRPYTDTEWHHVAGVRNGRVMDLFVDGRSAFFNPYDKTPFKDSGGNAFIGRQVHDRPTQLFEGLIDDVRIYNRPLSQPELAQALRTVPQADPGLVGYWNLDEAGGVFVVDRSGHANYGVLASTTGGDGPTWHSNDGVCQAPPALVVIAGTIRDPQGQAVAGVLVGEGTSAAITDAQGRYQLVVPAGWSGTVTPALTGTVFDPPARTYTALQADLLNEDYTATVIDTYYVDAVDGDDANTGYGPKTAFQTIQRGLDAAAAGHTVIVADGVYSGPGNRALTFRGKAVTLTSAHGPEAAIIDGGDQDRGFVLSQGEGPGTVIQGLTIRHCRAVQGAALLCQKTSPRVVDCRLLDNVSIQGGAVYLDSSDAELVGCVLAGNTATGGPGGALRCAEGFTQPVLRHCTLADNLAAGDGGALSCRAVTLQLRHCIVWGNQATGAGAQVSVVGATLTVQYSDLQGGKEAVHVSGGSLVWSAGNLNLDPLFGDPEARDYGLRSERGRYRPDLAVWALDEVTSPCIDAGDPTAPVGDEPKPNGERLNLGATGGTVRASLTPEACELVRDENADGQIDFDDLFVLIDAWLQAWSVLGSPAL